MIRKLVHVGIAYAFAIGSAALASLYGFISAEGMMAYAKAGILCLVAFGGCHGPAFVAHLRRAEGLPAAGLAALATAACVCVTLWGGLGTLASGGAQLRADRAKVSFDASRDRDELERLKGERRALPSARPAAAVQAELATSRASSLYKDSDGCDPEKISGPKTREHCRAFRALEAELASAREAARLDVELAEVSRRLDKAPPEIAEDPQALAFSIITGLPVNFSAALYALCASIALELFGMVAMMVAWSERKDLAPRVTSEKPKPKLEPLPAPSTQVAHIAANVVPIQQKKVSEGEVTKFMLERMPPHPGESVELLDIHSAYKAWCDGRKVRPVDERQFVKTFAAICKAVDIKTQKRDGKVYCVGRKLSA